MAKEEIRSNVGKSGSRPKAKRRNLRKGSIPKTLITCKPCQEEFEPVAFEVHRIWHVNGEIAKILQGMREDQQNFYAVLQGANKS